MSAVVEAELISSPMLVPRVDDLPPLTIKESAFIREYLNPNNYRNGTLAAKLAGYSGDDNTLASIAHQNLRKLHIQAHLQHALKQRHISPDEVIAELSDIAIAPWKDFVQVKYGPNNTILDVQLKLSEKIKCLDVLSDLLGMKREQVDLHIDQDQLVATFAAAFDRLRQQRAAEATPQLEAAPNPDAQP